MNDNKFQIISTKNDKEITQNTITEKTDLTINEYYIDQVNLTKSDSNNIDNKKKEIFINNQVGFDDDDSSLLEFNPDIINPFGNKVSDINREIKEHSPFRKFETYSV